MGTMVDSAMRTIHRIASAASNTSASGATNTATAMASTSVSDRVPRRSRLAARVMCDAIKRAGSAERTAIRDALASTKDFPGASGMITIDDQHNARKPIKVLEIQGGKTKLAESIAP